MISYDGYLTHSIWEHSSIVRDLYTRRCRQEEPEMDSSCQAADLLKELASAGESILDAGCGSGYFYHSLTKRGLNLDYTGVDAAPSLIQIGRSIMPTFGLSHEKLQVARIEDLAGTVDHVVCLNVLSNIDNYHKPLERLLTMARRSVILRESVDHEHARYAYVPDKYLDKGVALKVHINTYPMNEFVSFIESYGFSVEVVQDHRTKGAVEYVIDYPHYWKFFVAKRR